MTIIDDNELSRISRCSSSELDNLDYGVVEVDDAGVIKQYNRYESDLGNVPQSTAIGRNFFTQIAPCTNNRLLFGKFKEGVGSGSLKATVPYVFSYKMKPTNVTIQMQRENSRNWVIVKKR